MFLAGGKRPADALEEPCDRSSNAFKRRLSPVPVLSSTVAKMAAVTAQGGGLNAPNPT